jgi:hypothetical protein
VNDALEKPAALVAAHTYDLAVDVTGIGGPGTPEALLWHEIAARHGVICPYGPHNLVEWNHCQPTRVRIIVAENPLRETVTADGPLSLEGMFEVGYSSLRVPATWMDRTRIHPHIFPSCRMRGLRSRGSMSQRPSKPLPVGESRRPTAPFSTAGLYKDRGFPGTSPAGRKVFPASPTSTTNHTGKHHQPRAVHYRRRQS